MKLQSAFNVPALRSGFFLAVLFLSLSPLAATSARAEDASEQGIAQANEISKAFEKVAGAITPSVVSIMSVTKAKAPGRNFKGNDPFDAYREFFGDELFDRFFRGRPQGPGSPGGPAQQGLGTGVIVDNKGHILTNNHVIGEADEVTVRLQNDKSYKAKIVGTDPRSDLAVIQIKAEQLVPAKLGSSEALKIGEWVVAAGNPFGLNNSITAGIVSAKGRSFMGGGQYEDFIQTDAAINPGNSGGPLVNLRGEVVGINTAIFSRSGGYMGIGFAIPIDMAKHVMKSLIDKGKVVRGWLGVGIQNLSDELAKSFDYESTEGALVGHVESNGPAAEVGIKQGDIITSINGEKILNVNQLRNMVASIAPGTRIEVGLMRGNSQQTVTVKVGELPTQNEEIAAEEDESVDLGMSVETLSPDMARQLNSKKVSGVVVTNVRPGTVAENAGLQPRDIIVSINGIPVKDATQFNQTMGSVNLKKGVRLVVESGGMEHFIFLRSED